MEPFIRYILVSSLCLSISYLGYLVFQKNQTQLHHLRYFLLFSIVLSVLMPFSTFRINLDLSPNIKTTEEIYPVANNTIAQVHEPIISQPIVNPGNGHNWNMKSLLMTIYFIGLSFLGLRLLTHLLKILYLFYHCEKIRENRTTILLTDKIGSPFTFFNWTFVPGNYLKSDENKEILAHERIHASQYHSIDLFLIELLSAVMWFNPFVWMMRNSLELVHEYLADEGVLSTGTDKLRYQALLVNQAAEERLICLYSGFNHSLIKKRMIMMTKIKFNQHSKLRLLALIPLATVLFFGVACVNGKNKTKVVTAVEPVKMNVLYLGVDNPVKIAASGYDARDLTATIDNGIITGENGEFIIQAKRLGTAIVTVSSKGREIQKTTFRVKPVPDPVAAVAGNKGGNITKQELLNAKDIVVVTNFDFDVSFDVVEFNVITLIDGFVYEQKSNSNKITEKQKEIIAKIKDGTPVYFQDIKCKGPDGTVRKMPVVAFRVTE
ncbi:MAG: hypothetical protein JW798_16010 [Prolixibacteraceae bacterium]|nr:hypothetical protein [Prolixibacteraceae bacterium]